MTEDCPTCMNGLYLVDKLRAIELMDVRVTTVPEPSSPYHEPGMICPGCGTTWFLYPTDEQIAAWTRDGVA